MNPYETLDHEADVGIRGRGKTVEEAFGNGARALFSIMVDIDATQPIDSREVTCSAPDLETLFVEWLNHLISISHLERMVFSRFEVEIIGLHLKGRAWGERLDRDRHRPMTEVKAATYCMLSVIQEDDFVTAQCVVDV